MTRIEPEKYLLNKPCSICAIDTAFHRAMSARKVDEDTFISLETIFYTAMRDDGYCSLKDANKFIRSVFDVQKYLYFKKADRISLQTFVERYSTAGSACGYELIVCVLGHYIYLDFAQQKYWSFFDNLNDEVVAVWRLK